MAARVNRGATHRTPIAVLTVAGLLCLVMATGCYDSWSYDSPKPVEPLPTEYGAVEASGSLDASGAAQALLSIHSPGGTSATSMTVARIEPIYTVPAQGGTVSFDSLRPTGQYQVLVRESSQAVEAFGMRRDSTSSGWRYGSPPLGPNNYLGDLEVLREVAGAKPHAARFVWGGLAVSWWLVRYADGTEYAIPTLHMGPVSIMGTQLERRLYPTSVLRELMTWPKVDAPPGSAAAPN